jgi:hypothetical protein
MDAEDASGSLAVSGSAFGGLDGSKGGKVYSGNHSIKKLKQSEQQLHDIRQCCHARYFLRKVACFLAMLGLGLTAMVAEVCRYGKN